MSIAKRVRFSVLDSIMYSRVQNRNSVCLARDACAIAYT